MTLQHHHFSSVISSSSSPPSLAPTGPVNSSFRSQKLSVRPRHFGVIRCVATSQEEKAQTAYRTKVSQLVVFPEETNIAYMVGDIAKNLANAKSD